MNPISRPSARFLARSLNPRFLSCSVKPRFPVPGLKLRSFWVPPIQQQNGHGKSSCRRNPASKRLASGPITRSQFCSNPPTNVPSTVKDTFGRETRMCPKKDCHEPDASEMFLNRILLIPKWRRMKFKSVLSVVQKSRNSNLRRCGQRSSSRSIVA